MYRRFVKRFLRAMAAVFVYTAAVAGWLFGGAMLWAGRCQHVELSIHNEDVWGVFACTFTGGLLLACLGLAFVGVLALVLALQGHSRGKCTESQE